MQHKRKALFLILCLIAMTLLLTACHTDNDPWPVSEGNGSAVESPVQESTPAVSPDAAEVSAAPSDIPQAPAETSETAPEATPVPTADPNAVPELNG